MNPSNVIIHIDGLTKQFGRVQALNDLHLDVYRGEIFGYLGPNGAGKTTTLRILLGLLRADSGTVRLLGGDPWQDVTALHRRLAYVPGDVSLWPNLTGGEVIDLLGKLAQDHSKTVIYSTHDLQIALQQADRIWLIHGQAWYEGAPEDLVISGRLGESLKKTDSGTEIEMDPRTGEFALRREQGPEVGLSTTGGNRPGVECIRAWTQKALERNGFRVVEGGAGNLHVIVDTGDGSPKWTLEKSGNRIELNSIYDLSLYLRTIT